MLIIKRYLSFLLGIITFVFWETFFFFSPKITDKLLLHRIILGWFLLYIAILVLSLWYLEKNKLQDIRQKIAYFILPVVLVLNWVSFLVYLDFGRIFLHLMALFLGVAVWLYVESFFLKYYFVRFYKLHSFENMAEEIIIFTSFLVFVNFFSFKVYVDWAYYKLFIMVAVILLLLVFAQFAFNNLLTKKNCLIYLIVIPFLGLEFLFVSTFLPTNFYSLAMINTLFFYLFMIFARHHLLEKLSDKMARRYLSLIAILLIFILIISRWT
ncbi:MAG: hypothetical protein V1688_01495 [bacterium]